jgi:hypothetical protein
MTAPMTSREELLKRADHAVKALRGTEYKALTSSYSVAQSLAEIIEQLCSDAQCARKFYGAECPSYPECNGGCGLGCTKEVERMRGAQSARDEEHPDCATDRECELYDALMGLASHAAAFHHDYKQWTQGGVTLEPIVSKALRLGNFAISSADCGVEK